LTFSPFCLFCSKWRRARYSQAERWHYFCYKLRADEPNDKHQKYTNYTSMTILTTFSIKYTNHEMITCVAFHSDISPCGRLWIKKYWHSFTSIASFSQRYQPVYKVTAKRERASFWWRG
jgi:hypothetical protein